MLSIPPLKLPRETSYGVVTGDVDTLASRGRLEPPRYQVELRNGRRFEPWITGVEQLAQQPVVEPPVQQMQYSSARLQ